MWRSGCKGISGIAVKLMFSDNLYIFLRFFRNFAQLSLQIFTYFSIKFYNFSLIWKLFYMFFTIYSLFSLSSLFNIRKFPMQNRIVRFHIETDENLRHNRIHTWRFHPFYPVNTIYEQTTPRKQKRQNLQVMPQEWRTAFSSIPSIRSTH